ncbi:MAG: acetolactate synthase small subunit [Candidatus Ranarchaeia archaeon]|jgi:acetolactate synthase-1/3 small subunit
MSKTQRGSPYNRTILGILVEDEPGVLNRISGMFSRRGFNISTVTVGKTFFPGISRITISFPPDEYVLSQIKSQLGKIVTVRKIIELWEEESVVRDYALVKLDTENGKKTEEIKDITERHHSQVMHVGKSSIIVEILGTPELLDEVIGHFKAYTILEISRTGINAIRRNSQVPQKKKPKEQPAKKKQKRPKKPAK